MEEDSALKILIGKPIGNRLVERLRVDRRTIL